MLAELVVLRLQEVLAGLLLAPADSEAWLQALPPPLFRGNEASGQAICLKGDALLSAVASAKVQHTAPLSSTTHTFILCSSVVVQCI